MRKQLTLLTLLVTSITLAQNFKFGKVSKEELMEKSNSNDPDAEAAILYREHKTDFKYSENGGFYIVTDVFERVKIYNPKGFDWGTVEVILYEESNRNKEVITGLKGYTYYMDGSGKIQEEKLRKEGIFEEKLNKYRSSTKFTMPALKEGCVIEYEYSITSPFISNIDTYTFQESIPVNNVHLSFRAPEYFNYKMHRKGWLTYDVKESTRPRSMDYRYTRSSLDTKSVVGNTVTQTVKFNENVYEVDLSNIPALKKEKYAGNMKNYTAALNFELSYTKFPQAPLEMYATDWESVSEKIYKSENFGGQLNRTRYFEDDVDALLAGKTTPNDKMIAIYEFIKNKMNWNKYIGIYADEGVKEAYKSGVGSVGDINLMLTSMFRYAKLNAYPVLVSSKANGIPLFPTRNGFNYVISAVQVNDGFVLFDATNKNGVPNILDEDLLNWQGRLIKEDGTSSWVGLQPSEVCQSAYIVNASLEADGSFSGETKGQYTGNKGLEARKKYDGMIPSEVAKEFQPKRGQILNVSFENMDNPYESLKVNYNFDATDWLEDINGSYYLSPMFFYSIDENPFKLEERNYPIDYSYPSKERYIFSIDIPEGYQVESVPESVNLVVGENDFGFKYIFSQRGNKLQLLVDFSVNIAMVNPVNYEEVKAFYQAIVEKEKEKIIVSKI